MEAIIFAGGWEGHAPTKFADWAETLLIDVGFSVERHNSLAPLTDPQKMETIDLIIPIWSSARSSHSAEWGASRNTVCLRL